MRYRTPPVGVVVIAGVGILEALWAIASGVGMATVGPLGPVLGPIVALLGVGQLLVCIGLLSLNSVAWVLAMVLYGLSFVLDLFTLNIVSLVVGGLIIVYLFSKRGMYMGNERSVARGLR